MRNRIISISFLILISIPSKAQNNTEQFPILFYNVENLFDTKENPYANDSEFTPNGGRYWNSKKLNTKLNHISKVILNCNAWEYPAIVALSEVENRDVLVLLTKTTALKSIGYKIIHKDSPDHRGIDVAILYDSKQFYPISYKHYPMLDTKGGVKKTREILYVSGIVNEIDTIHVFVNHWSSRYSGVLETQQGRNSSAGLLRSKVDELNEKFKAPKIIIVGDFNDQPTDESILNFLKAKKIGAKILNQDLYNLSYYWGGKGRGTLKYRSQWSVFDQVIVSGTLLTSKVGVGLKPENAGVVDLPFLLEADEKYGGIKPKRTYYGYTYKGGFSDHLPVLIKLNIAN
jgi:endonuclease/exonuclease/phosphatase family metal-dependent hydrolase